MASRRRVGVVVELPPVVAEWVNGLRRGLDDRAIGRISPHITLVPPLNLPDSALDSALERLRFAAAAAAEPIRLRLGPVATFLPANPVVFLAVGGEVERLAALRRDVFVAPLHRAVPWPWVPHVTLADDAEPDRIEAAIAALSGFAVEVSIDRVVLLEERRDVDHRRWTSLADVALDRPAIIGTGGLELSLIKGRTACPVAADLLGAVSSDSELERRVVVTARQERRTVGAAMAWLADDGGHVAVAVAEGHRRRGIGSHLLAAIEQAVTAEGWRCDVLRASGPAGFYQARSAWSRRVS